MTNTSNTKTMYLDIVTFQNSQDYEGLSFGGKPMEEPMDYFFNHMTDDEKISYMVQWDNGDHEGMFEEEDISLYNLRTEEDFKNLHRNYTIYKGECWNGGEEDDRYLLVYSASHGFAALSKIVQVKTK
jgi:hypothetical protein